MMWHRMGGRGGMGPGGGMMAGHMGEMHGRGPMPAAEVTVEDIERGARIALTPVDASELGVVRERVRLHAGRMGDGECWMVQETRGEAFNSADGG